MRLPGTTIHAGVVANNASCVSALSACVQAEAYFSFLTSTSFVLTGIVRAARRRSPALSAPMGMRVWIVLSLCFIVVTRDVKC